MLSDTSIKTERCCRLVGHGKDVPANAKMVKITAVILSRVNLRNVAGGFLLPVFEATSGLLLEISLFCRTCSLLLDSFPSAFKGITSNKLNNHRGSSKNFSILDKPVIINFIWISPPLTATFRAI